MIRILIVLLSVANYLSCTKKHDTSDPSKNMVLEGLYIAQSPINYEMFVYVFDRNKFHVFVKPEKESDCLIYRADFKYFVGEDSVIYACNTALTCSKKTMFEPRFKILTVEENNNHQIVNLEAKFLDSPLILSKDLK